MIRRTKKVGADVPGCLVFQAKPLRHPSPGCAVALGLALAAALTGIAFAQEAPGPAPEPAAAAESGTAPSPGSPEAPGPSAETATQPAPLPAVPAGGEPSPTASAAETTARPVREGPTVQVYEYVETVSVRREGAPGSDGMLVSSSQCVVVRSDGDTVRVELRPDAAADRPPGEGDPPRGVAMLRGAGSSGESRRALPAAEVEFSFQPGKLGSLDVKGLRGGALVELATMLSQARAALPIRALEESAYDMELLADGRPYTLRARQRNGELWVDWSLSGDGEIRVGSGEVQLPLEFLLPEQEAVPARMKLSSSASMRYSSARPGPEAKTSVRTTLTFPLSQGALVYERAGELRPLALRPEDLPPLGGRGGGPRPAGPDFLAGEGLCGAAGLWARSCTLAMLGVQQIAGVRDVGLAIWLAQASADAAAGRHVEKAASAPARAASAAVRKLSPELAAPPGLVPEGLAGGPLLRAVVSAGSCTLDEGQAGTVLFGKGTGTSVSASVSARWRRGERWLLGFGAAGTSVQSIEANERFWYTGALLARIEHSGKRFNLAAGAGPAVVWYEFQNGTDLAGGDVGALGAELNLEWRLSKRWGLFADCLYASDFRAAEATDLTVGLRCFLRSNLAFQVGVGSASLVDEQGELGKVEQAIPFAGSGSLVAGLQAKW